MQIGRGPSNQAQTTEMSSEGDRMDLGKLLDSGFGKRPVPRPAGGGPSEDKIGDEAPPSSRVTAPQPAAVKTNASPGVNHWGASARQDAAPLVSMDSPEDRDPE